MMHPQKVKQARAKFVRGVSPITKTRAYSEIVAASGESACLRV